MTADKKIKKIIFAAHDAGGADALMPVIKRLVRDRSFKILNLFTGPATAIARRNKITFINAEGYDATEIARRVADFCPRLVLTGTSSGVFIDKKVFRAARRLGVATAAILDSWINYSLQFNFHGRSKIISQDLPDHILVMDEIARREMIKEGFPKNKIIVTGNPHFDGFRKFRKVRATAFSRAVFIDQHLSELMKKGIHENLGYTELEVFRDLAKALEELRWRGELILKFHPGSQDLSRFNETIAHSTLHITKAKRSERLAAIFDRSHFVFGMTSMALFEAALGGKTVLSYQPGLKRKADPLISNRLGLSSAVYERQKLKPTLKKILVSRRASGGKLRQIKKYTKHNATREVLKVINSLSSID